VAALFSAHWPKHSGKLPPPATHVRKQLTFCMQPADAWHVAKAWQQLCCKQFWHVEPSDGQFAVPQMPVVHAPVQHSAAVMHDWPLGLHAAPQMPLLQTPVQQSAKPTQVEPSGLQPQTPPTHLFEQHSAAVMQASPSGKHMGLPQTPFEH